MKSGHWPFFFAQLSRAKIRRVRRTVIIRTDSETKTPYGEAAAVQIYTKLTSNAF